MLSEKLLKQVAEEFALAMNESLPKPEQCQHQFSEEFERKMQRLLFAVPINTQIVVAAPELSYNQTYLELIQDICCTILMIYGQLTARIIKMKINYGLSIIHCCFYSRLLAICNVALHSLMFILKISIKFL